MDESIPRLLRIRQSRFRNFSDTLQKLSFLLHCRRMNIIYQGKGIFADCEARVSRIDAIVDRLGVDERLVLDGFADLGRSFSSSQNQNCIRIALTLMLTRLSSDTRA